MLSTRSLPRLLVAAILACATAASSAQSVGQLPRGEDFAALASEARARRVPIMIAFVQESCVYCALAKREYLVPMHLDAGLRERVIIREVDIDRRGELRDFKGRPATAKAFAKRYHVALVPTVVIVDDRGEPIAPPVVGVSAADFYGIYLEQAVDAGLAKLRAAPGPRGAGAAPR